MVVLDIAIVNVALQSINEDLNFSSTENLQWIVSGYALTFGGFLLLGGRLGDVLGRRRVFMVGLALFAATSLLAGLSTSSAMLIGARVAQGAAGAILSPSVFSITSVTFQEGSERNKALGVLGAISGAGAAIGVILGGVLTTYLTWRWIFFVNVPIGLGTLFFVPRLVRESRAEGMARKFDSIGAVLVTGGLMLFVYALTRTNQVGWSSAETILEFIGSALLIGAFILWESKSEYALVPLSIFRRRTLTGANIIGLMLGTMVFGMFFLLSLYMQQVLGFTPLKTGIGYLAVALTAVVASGAAQALVTKTGVKPALLAGLALVGGGLLYFTQISANGSYFSDLFPGFIILGIGLGFTFVPISIAALAGVTGRDAGLASGLINTSQQIGGALGLAILTTVATSHITKLAPDGNPTAADLTSGYALAFWVATGVAAAAIVTTLLIVQKRIWTSLRPRPRRLRPSPSALSNSQVGRVLTRLFMANFTSCGTAQAGSAVRFVLGSPRGSGDAGRFRRRRRAYPAPTRAQVDADHDGVDDSTDNCVGSYNPDQKDYDTDGKGDRCDATPYPASHSEIFFYPRNGTAGQAGSLPSNPCFHFQWSQNARVDPLSGDGCNGLWFSFFYDSSDGVPNDITVTVNQTSGPAGCSGSVSPMTFTFGPGKYSAVDIFYDCTPPPPPPPPPPPTATASRLRLLRLRRPTATSAASAASAHLRHLHLPRRFRSSIPPSSRHPTRRRCRPTCSRACRGTAASSPSRPPVG